MNPTLSPLLPLFTVPNFQQRLTALRPVQVYTYVFPRDEHALEQGSRMVIGTLYPFQGLTALPPHDHEHHEIAIVTAGTAIHQTQSGTSQIGPGHVVAVAPGEVHGFYRISGLHLLNCTYLLDWLLDDIRELLREDGLVPLFLHTALFAKTHRFRVPVWRAAQESVDACLGDLEDMAIERNREEPCPGFLRWCLKKVMLRLHRAFQASGENTHLMSFDPVVQTALEHIEDCVVGSVPFGVARLAAQLRMNADYFSRAFREATGLSPMDYFQRRRVQYACSMLLNSEQTVTDVAHQLGYCDAAHFCHLFKRHRGTTPTAFRDKYGALSDAC